MDVLLRRAAPALHATSLGTVGLCIGLWIRAKTVSQEERGNAERRALFVGLWPAMFWLLGDAVERRRFPARGRRRRQGTTRAVTGRRTLRRPPTAVRQRGGPGGEGHRRAGSAACPRPGWLPMR